MGALIATEHAGVLGVHAQMKPADWFSMAQTGAHVGCICPLISGRYQPPK